ncbi:MAG: hypothetical protein H7338_23575 [Candidatus Sericytochromatia bacterium]|nr:hypothetical protein [Candidatus Sericytochromatia bacterium]
MAPNDNEISGNRDLFSPHHFRECDVNRDGFLSPYEAGPPDLFDTADVNHDGKLAYAEFHDSEMYRYQITRQLEQVSREFWSMDLDFDMQLTQREVLRQSMLNLPRNITEKDLLAVDLDENDRLGYREFQLLYQRLWKETMASRGRPPKLSKATD